MKILKKILISFLCLFFATTLMIASIVYCGNNLLIIISFVLWTILICIIDIQEIGPQNTSVGFATINKFIHNMTGVNMFFYAITDWLSVIPVLFVLGFALLGLIQLIQRKNILKV